MLFAVCGLHLRGGPLNHQMVSLGATFVREALTTSNYTMHALSTPDTPSKPGLVLHPNGCETSAALPVEVWEMPEAAIGSLLKYVPSPLGFGTVLLEGGDKVYGFICEGWAADPVRAKVMGIDSVDITSHGGWRNYADKVLSKGA